MNVIDLINSVSSCVFRDNKQNFHEYCDGVPNTITVVSNEYGHVFTGYISKPWDKQKGMEKIQDYKAFICSIKSTTKDTAYNKEIFSQEFFRNDKQYGPMIGYNLVIPNNTNLMKTGKGHISDEVRMVLYGTNNLKQTIIDYEVFELVQGPRTIDYHLIISN